MKLLPMCLGKYDKRAAVCNGERKSSYPDDREPCLFRDKCSAFARQLEHQGGQPSDHLVEAKVSIEGQARTFSAPLKDEFSDWLVKLVKLWDVEQGRARNSKPLDRRPARLGGARKQPNIAAALPNIDWRKRAKAKRARRDESEARADRIVGWFKRCIHNEMFVPVGSQLAGTPIGGLFMEQSKGGLEFTLCQRTSHDKRVIMALRPNGSTVDNSTALFPVNPEVVSKFMVASKLRVQSAEWGKNTYASRLSGLDREGIAWCAKLVARLVKSGNIRVVR